MLTMVLGMSSVRGQEQEVLAGVKQLYQKFCESCHGPRARGNGPLSDSMHTKPADLTKLATNNGNLFPFWQTYRTIDGRHQIPEHGMRDMPVFGNWFRIPHDEVSVETVGGSDSWKDLAIIVVPGIHLITVKISIFF